VLKTSGEKNPSLLITPVNQKLKFELFHINYYEIIKYEDELICNHGRVGG
jgi:hypothetical protein